MPAVVVVLTRFAIQGWDRPPPEPEWIRRRWDLWSRVSLPAYAKVAAPLAVLLFACPERRDHVERLVRSTAGADIARVVPTTSTFGLAPTGIVDLPASELYLGVRCDSDDVISPRVLDELALACTRGRADFYDLASGYVLDAMGESPAHLVRYSASRQGPYFAHREHRREHLFRMDRAHAGAREGRRVRRMTRPAWVQVVHGENVLNRVPEPLRPRFAQLRRGTAAVRSVDPSRLMAGLRVLDLSEVSEAIAT